MHNDILDRLRIDPGQRTLGQLLQDREAAAYEIARLRSLGSELAARERERHAEKHKAVPTGAGNRPPAFRSGTLLRLRDVGEMLALSRSTIYNLLSRGLFPAPTRIGRSIRWPIEAVEVWRDEKRPIGS